MGTTGNYPRARPGREEGRAVSVRDVVELDVIQNGVPIPPVSKSGGHPTKRNWAAMKVGDCILKRNFSDVVSARYWGKRHGCKFKARKRREPPYGYRIWRIA
jgi:hypothetical protein